MMQTKITAFLEHGSLTGKFRKRDDAALAERDSEEKRPSEYASVYPDCSPRSNPEFAFLRCLSRKHQSTFPNLKDRSMYRQRGAQLCRTPPAVRTVVSSIHTSRSSEDGEQLLTSLDSFKNSVIGSTWDPADEFIISTRRSCFQLFGASSWLSSINDPQPSSSPLVELNMSTVQARSQSENRISFGFSATQFLGNTLNVVCGYSGAPLLDFFDLEDLDEATGESLHTCDLRSIQFDSRLADTGTAPATTAVVALSDKTVIAALTNGCTVIADTRSAAPILCTQVPYPSTIVDLSASNTNNLTPGTPSTAVEVVDRAQGVQLLTGAKNGAIALWDLRFRNQPVAKCTLKRKIETFCTLPLLPISRCGAPLVWLNTDNGNIYSFSIGATSFTEVHCVSTNDTQRSQYSANLPPAKICVLPLLQQLFYPHVATNTLLVYDISHRCPLAENTRHSLDESDSEGGRKKFRCEAGNDFSDAGSLLQRVENERRCDDSRYKVEEIKVDLPLMASIPFHDWSHQICSVSSSRRHIALCVGGDDGDLHLLTETRLEE